MFFFLGPTTSKFFEIAVYKQQYPTKFQSVQSVLVYICPENKQKQTKKLDKPTWNLNRTRKKSVKIYLLSTYMWTQIKLCMF